MMARAVLRNGLGAFSDGAVLLPLLALLSSSAGMSGTLLLVSAGLTYVVSALVFRVPMSVQPLKSIAVAAVVLGASALEVRMSAFLLGAACLVLCFFDVERLARRVPIAVVHQLQVGLGVLLVMQGASTHWSWVGVAVAAVMILRPEVAGIPILGLLATAGIVWGVSRGLDSPGVAPSVVSVGAGLRPEMIAGLLLPQLVLTWANSVLATRIACEKYFGARASRVTIRRLLSSIGVGNLLVGVLGGMPFCHGAGGRTAHVRGGATQAASTALMGAFLLTLGAAQWASGSEVLRYPEPLIFPLLVATGIFHMQLAERTAQTNFGRIKLTAALLLALVFRNLLWVLAFAVLLEVVEFALEKRHPKGAV